MFRDRLIWLLPVFVSLTFAGMFPGDAEERAITKASDLNCATANISIASVTSVNTGLGVGKFSFDKTADVLPPCTGNPPSQPAPFTEYPLPAPIPQLAKLFTDAGQCSADFISQNAVITAAHCIFAQGQFVKNIQIIPGYQNEQNTFNRVFTGEFVLTFDAYTSSNIAAHDIAVVRFQDALPQEYGFYGMSSYNVSHCGNLVQKEYTEPHYSPNINNNKNQAGAEGVLAGCVQGMVVTTLPLLPGSSGSAVIDHFSRSVFAVHSQYNPYASFDAILTHAKICTIDMFVSGANKGNVGDCQEGY